MDQIEYNEFLSNLWDNILLLRSVGILKLYIHHYKLLKFDSMHDIVYKGCINVFLNKSGIPYNDYKRRVKCVLYITRYLEDKDYMKNKIPLKTRSREIWKNTNNY